MKYYLFIDESGDHGLVNIDPGFPVFVLCGIITSENNYRAIINDFNNIKKTFWAEKKVIFHSRDIRKCEKEFSVFFNEDIKRNFYIRINKVISKNDYTIIASAINKEKYIRQYGRLLNDVYEIALSFIIERAIFYLDDLNDMNKDLTVVIEKRGKLEDKKLDEHFQRIRSRGTGYVTAGRLFKYNLEIVFKDKKDNDSGLQLSDLIAYPIARYVIDPDRANPAFDIFSDKFYTKKGKRYGLKVFP